MNKQKILDTVFKKLMKQGRPAINDDDEPMYQLGELRCSMGHLIPDKLYDQYMEGESIERVLGMYPHVANHLKVNDEQDEDFLMSIQESMHDGFIYEEERDFKTFLRDGTTLIAKRFKLKDPTKRKTT